MHAELLLSYFTRITLAITWGAFTGCSHIPASLSHFLMLVLSLLLFLILTFFCKPCLSLSPSTDEEIYLSGVYEIAALLY